MANKQTEHVSTKRSADLNSRFIDGFADGWYMALKESFKIELDIKLTERKKNKASYFEWTQGPYYCFSEGQLIYDTKEAYTCWQDALKKVTLACQIIEAKSNIPKKINNDITGKSEFTILEGYVRFLLLKPDEDRTKLIPYIGYNISQNEFVCFLKTGKI